MRISGAWGWRRIRDTDTLFGIVNGFTWGVGLTATRGVDGVGFTILSFCCAAFTASSCSASANFVFKLSTSSDNCSRRGLVWGCGGV